MANKVFSLADFGDITITKRTSSRNIRLSIKADGKVTVSIPAWASYRSGLAFAESKLEWIRRQLPERTLLKNGQPIGKYHHLQLTPTRGLHQVKTLVTNTSLIVRYPLDLDENDPAVQTAAEAACVRALRKQAEQLLPDRLTRLAEQHGFTFASVRIKRLKGRWGSCDQHQNIVLNLFLMQLPWECIDYVLLHELTHTRIMQHGPTFWRAMEQVIPNLAAVRKLMRQHRPVLY